MIKILHGADFHLDSPFEALPPEKAMAQRAMQRELLDQLIDMAILNQVDAILLAGDILDSDKAYFETREALAKTFSKTNIPIFISPGNHDFYHRHAPWTLALPKNVHVFDKNELEAIEIPEKNLVVWGAAFTQSHSPGLLGNFTPPEPDGKIHVMVLHGDVGGTEYYNPIHPEEIKASKMHYIALGHKHRYSGLQQAGNVFYAYPGVFQGRGFDEQGPCGVILAKLTPSSVRIDFCPLKGRQYHHIQMDVSDVSNIKEAIEKALPKNPKESICRISLLGETDEHVSISSLTEIFESQCFHLEIRDQLSLRRNIWNRAEEDNLRGLFLRKMRLAYDGAQTEEERQKIILAVRFAISAMEQGDQLGVMK